MPIGLNPLIFALGQQWGIVNPQRTQLGEDVNMRSNLAKLFSYIPGISFFVGVLRIIGLFQKEQFKQLYPSLGLPAKEEDAMTIRVALRALAELLSFSFLLLIADIIADLLRLNR